MQWEYFTGAIDQLTPLQRQTPAIGKIRRTIHEPRPDFADCIEQVAAPLCVGPKRQRVFDLYSAIACLKMLAPSPLSVAGPPSADNQIAARLRTLLDAFAATAHKE
ncbi:hypothetical protein OG562_23090 [Streptomyces sp. NBC_01275]|uniref:hypothetical protein n=1 Tax=Streptomyces sp. NBC_01275 TaxID=2903807 RepID=UPI00225606B8|nr:hypothetical protein [Streptomyces sp. NBC_01275]MCX4763799.1 hypothetical protein [Streptomyces sp. NBC_01275]